MGKQCSALRDLHHQPCSIVSFDTSTCCNETGTNSSSVIFPRIMGMALSLCMGLRIGIAWICLLHVGLEIPQPCRKLLVSQQNRGRGISKFLCLCGLVFFLFVFVVFVLLYLCVIFVFLWVWLQLGVMPRPWCWDEVIVMMICYSSLIAVTICPWPAHLGSSQGKTLPDAEPAHSGLHI